MKVKDKILEIIYYLNENENIDFTTSELTKLYPVKRNVISHYLNRLTEEGVLVKINTRPVKYRLNEELKVNDIKLKSEETINNKEAFYEFIGYDGSLINEIEKCKSAVLYPPNGLSMIIQGNSGVGKSFLVSLIHKYSVNKGIIKKNAPFIVLNCADYSNNPELLSAALFGYKKGAFTGANEDRYGLLHEADGGYLFLDEIHRLSFENQEKLFQFLDLQKYRRLGENDIWQRAQVRIIYATTENLNGNLLTTFRRRIPLSIRLLDFKDRPLNEKIEIIEVFFKNEAKTIKKDMKIDPRVLNYLITYPIEGNIGGIKNQIKVMCATALMKDEKAEVLTIEGIPIIEEDCINNILLKYMDNYMYVSPNDKEDKRENISFFEDRKLLERLIELPFLEVSKELEIYIDLVISKIKLFYGGKENLIYRSSYKLIISVLRKLLDKIKMNLGIEFNDKDFENIYILIINSIFLENKKCLEFKNIENNIKKENFKSFIVANKIIYNIEKVGFDIPEYFEVILAAYLSKKVISCNRINGIILTHGESTASSIAGISNNLCGDYIYESFDMAIETRTKEIVEKVKSYVDTIDTRGGLIVLVDMGSLEDLYEPIKSNISGDLIIINNVSTSIAINIGMKIKNNASMNDIIELTKDKFKNEIRYYEGVAKGNNIIISCISGIGIALKIKKVLSNYFDKEDLEILTMEYSEIKSKLNSNNKNLFKDTKFILTTTNLKGNGVPIINVEDIVKGIAKLSDYTSITDEETLDKITDDIVKLFTIEGASRFLDFLNPAKIIDDIDEVIKKYETLYNIHFESFIRMNLFLHLSAMIERIIMNKQYEDELEKDSIIRDSKEIHFINTSNVVFKDIIYKYNIEIPISEYILVYEIVKFHLEK